MKVKAVPILKNDLHTIRAQMTQGELLLGARELSGLLTGGRRLEKVKEAIAVIEELQGRWVQRQEGILDEEYRIWIEIGIFLLEICRELEENVSTIKRLSSKEVLDLVGVPLPEYEWYGSSVLILIRGRQYFLQGFHATLFDHLVHSPLFLAQLRGTVEEKRTVIDDLAIALATWDRRYIVPRAQKVLEALWKQERWTGLSLFMDLLGHHHWQNNVWEGYSDHFTHILNVYLTGIYIFQECDALREELLREANCNGEEFLRRWLYVSILHDMGYIFELSDTEKPSEILEFLQDQILHFFYYHDQRMTTDLARVGIAPGTVSKKISKEIFSQLKIKFDQLQYPDQLAKVKVMRKHHQKELLEILDELCQGTGLGVDGISNYYNACFASAPLKANGRGSFYDHGIMSALLLLYVGYKVLAIFQALHKQLSQSIRRARGLIRTGRMEVLRVMSEWMEQADSYLTTIEQAATAIALHNICKHLWKSGETPRRVDLTNFWIRIDREPLAFFLILIDTLQNWDRPCFDPRHPREQVSLSGDIVLEIDSRNIFLDYPYKTDEFEMTMQFLKSMLLPSQVDSWIVQSYQRQHVNSVFKTDRGLAGYNQKVLNRLQGSEADPFIELQIMPVNLRMQPSSSGDSSYSIFQVAEQFAQKPIALLGAPGVGKTTLVKQLAIQHAKTGDRVPVFVDMSLYVEGEDFLSLGQLRQTIDEATLNTLLKEGRIAVIFDGLNEVSIDHRGEAARAIGNFINNHPQNQFFITCRTSEYPTFLPADVRRFEVLRISQEEVRGYLTRIMGVEQGTRLYNRLSPVVRDLCRIPLMLAMLTYVYKEDRGSAARDIPTSKVALYEEFLNHLFEREEAHYPYQSSGVREAFLIYIAQKMENKQVAVKREKAAQWVEELYRERYQNLGVQLATIWHEVLEFPPLVASRPGQGPDVDISFMHQTFQEYYTARGLLMHIQQGRRTIEEVVFSAASTSMALDRWWETLTLLVGMMDDATVLIKTIKELAIKQKNHRLLRLVADCICEASSVEAAEVDNVILHIILEFKYGAVPFDYELVESLQSIKPEKRSSDFPARLLDDINWWVVKYAKERGLNLGNTVSLDVLLDYLESDDESLVLNALSTLRNRSDRGTTIKKLIEKLQTSTGIVREQVIVTIGYLEQDAISAVDLLMTIMNDKRENDWARLHAIAALSRIGDVRTVEGMLDYIRDYNNPYRDTASWAPLRMVKLHPEDKELHRRVKEALMQDLLLEPDTEDGRYAKGNALYVLGELGAVEYARDIAAWLTRQTEAYVIEDGIHTLGLLGGITELPIIEAQLSNDDFVVRMIAADALAQIQTRMGENIDVRPLLEKMLEDKVVIVKEHVAKKLEELCNK